jgi:hypothetical protein
MNARPHDGRLGSRSLILVALSMLTAGASCAGGSGGTTGTGGSSSTGTGGIPSTGGATGTGGSGTGGASIGTGGTNVGTGGVTGTGGATSTGGTTGSGGATGTGGSTSTGGSTASGGAAGGSAGAKGSGGAAASGGATGSAGSGGCPSDATFCSGFEETSGPPVNMPVGTATLEAYTGTFTDLMALDSTVFHSGKQSLKVLSGTGMSAFKMLSVPIPGPTFWAHMYIRSDDTFGDMTAVHNTFFQAMTSPDPNSTGQVQVAEQWCQVLLNVNDTLYPTGLSSCSTTGPTLSPNVWHCVEAFFDGPNGVVQVYGDNTKIIDAEQWSPATETYGTFEFGFRQVSGPARNMWYDDVVVGKTRVGCP